MHIYVLWFFWVFRVIVYFWSYACLYSEGVTCTKVCALKSVSPSQVIKCCSQVRQPFFLFFAYILPCCPSKCLSLLAAFDDRQPWAFSSSVPFGEHISWQLLRRHHCQEFLLSASSWHWVAFSSSAFASGPALPCFLVRGTWSLAGLLFLCELCWSPVSLSSCSCG